MMCYVVRLLILLTITSIACADWVLALSSDILREIADYDRQIQQNRELIRIKEAKLPQLDEEMLKAHAALIELERRTRSLSDTLDSLRADNQKTKRLFEAALSHPEIADTAKLERLRQEYQSVKARLSETEAESVTLDMDLNMTQKAIAALKKQKHRSELELDELYRGTRRLIIRKPVIVEAYGECLMHEDITVRACKEMALLKAKQDVVEKGGVSIVRSLTEVSLRDIKRDDIRVETTGQIRQIELLQQPTFSQEGEYGKWSVEIRAVVQSQVAEHQATESSPLTQEDKAVQRAKLPNGRPEMTMNVPAAGPGSNSYLARVQQRISSFWQAPPGGLTAEALLVVIRFRLARNGTVTAVVVEQSSGVEYYDLAAKRAVLNADPLPPFPKELTEPYYDIKYSFVVGGQGVTVTDRSAFYAAYNDYLNGRYDMAVTGFEKFTKDFPTASSVPNAYYWLGESYYNLKDYVRAMQAYEQVVNDHPAGEKVPAALYRIGLCATEVGDTGKARKYLKRVLEEFAVSEEAKLAKTKLAEIR